MVGTSGEKFVHVVCPAATFLLTLLSGQAFLDYVHAITRLDTLHLQVDDPDAVPDAAQAMELEELCRTIPKLLDILPDILSDQTDPRHNIALSIMTSALIAQIDRVRPLLVVRPSSHDHMLL
jgi:nuclear pore complex protein Nup98-Nup96